MFFRKRIVIVLCLIALHSLITKSGLLAQNVTTYTTIPAAHSVTNSASVGTYGTVTIFGYTSPDSVVELTSTISLATTTSDGQGYFEFSTVSIDSATYEVCIMGTDTQRRSTQPSCFPFSTSYYGKRIGPIMLSPTLSVQSNILTVNAPIILTGQAPADSKVTLHYFTTQAARVNPIKLQSRTISHDQSITTTSDKDGLFSFTVDIPFLHAVQFYSFAQRNELLTDKSINLYLPIPPFWRIFLKKIALLLFGNSFDLLGFMLGCEILGICLFVIFLKYRTRSQALMIIENKLMKLSLLPSRRVVSLLKS